MYFDCLYLNSLWLFDAIYIFLLIINSVLSLCRVYSCFFLVANNVVILQRHGKGNYAYHFNRTTRCGSNNLYCAGILASTHFIFSSWSFFHNFLFGWFYLSPFADRRPLLGDLPLGFYVCLIHCDDDTVSHPNSTLI